MTDPTHLTSPHNPRIKAVIQLRRQTHRLRLGRFIAEGTREITRAIHANLPIIELYWSPETSPNQTTAQQALFEQQPASNRYIVTPKLMAKIAYRQNPPGLLAVVEQPRWQLQDIPAKSTGNDLWLVPVGTQKPGNLGAMARTADAARCTAVLVCDAVVDPFNPNAIRASTGAVFRLPVIAGSTHDILAFLTSCHARIIISSPSASTAYTDADLTGPVALVVGPEDVGLDDQWLSTTNPAINPHQAVSIPMAGQTVDSLNAAAAAAVLLFEAVRQRRRENC